jgi:hypothetical protein
VIVIRRKIILSAFEVWLLKLDKTSDILHRLIYNRVLLMVKLSTFCVSLSVKQNLYSVYPNHRLTYIFSLTFKGYSFLFVC